MTDSKELTVVSVFEQTVDVMARAYYDWCVLSTDDPDEQSRWEDIGAHQEFARTRARVMLRAALDFVPTIECETCGGCGFVPVDGPIHNDVVRGVQTSDNVARFEQCDCSDGRRPDPDVPRLMFGLEADAMETFIAGDGQPAIRARKPVYIEVDMQSTEEEGTG